MSDLSGKVIVVTGAVGNLGAAASARFRDLGAGTVLVDHSTGRLRVAFPEIADSAQHLLLEGLDASDAKAMSSMTEAAVERFGRIDGLFATVGAFAGGKAVHEEDPATWERMFAANVRTALITTRAVIPVMRRASSGSMVLTAGRPALAAPAGLAAYASAKAGVLRLAESLSAELKDGGVRVNAVVPGIIDTPQNREAMPEADHDTWVAPEAVADVAAFLLSDAARAVTGAAIPVYGRG